MSDYNCNRSRFFVCNLSKDYGLRTVFTLTFEFVSLTVGGTFRLLESGGTVCRLSVFASGIPGVGVAPFGSGLPIFAASGIPGVGVPPFGALLTLILAGSGIPGVVLPEGGTGLVENPGGRFVELLVITIALAFVFVVAAELHAEFTAIKASIKINKTFFDIKK